MSSEQSTPKQNSKQTARELVARRKQQTPASSPVAKAVAQPKAGKAVATVSKDEYRSRYLDAIAPSGIVGRLIKFAKGGLFATSDDEQEIAQSAEFIALCDETVIGWQKFVEDGPPEKIAGLLFDGFVLPPRESLGDDDETEWDEGLDGRPSDPWQHFIFLVLQDTKTSELFTFTTSSKTGRRAVAGPDVPPRQSSW
jgi:hypothetical protein